MVVFPQLSSGAPTQYPALRRRRTRAITNQLLDGTVVGFADSGVEVNSWDLTLRDLCDSECDAIRILFEAVEGRKGTFTFVDPTANLLAHSEELSDPAWTKSPMVSVTPGVDDPLGGAQAVRLINGSQTSQGIEQALECPASFGYSFSLYARSAADAMISMSRSSSGATFSRMFTLGSAWTRCILAGSLNATDTAIRFGVTFPAGVAVDVFGLQVEAQPWASSYKRTRARSGVYCSARFDHDILRVVSDGPDQHRLNLRIIARD